MAEIKSDYQGMALHTSFEGGREPVGLDLRPHTMVVSHSKLKLLNAHLDITRVKLRLGGNNGRLLFVRHPLLNDIEIYTEFNSALRKALHQIPELARQVESQMESARAGHRRSWLIATAVLAVVVGIVVYRGAIFGNFVSLIPFSTEKKLADLVLAKKKTSEGKTDRADQMLRKLTDQLLRGEPDWQKLLTFHISSKKEVNAYATLGGHIFVNRGLIEIMQTPEQLIGVLGHEMVHSRQRHVARSIFQGLGLFAIVQLLFGDVTGIVAVLADQGAPLLMLQYSRELETEADELAVTHLLKAEIDPQGLVEALRLLDQETKKLLKDTPGGEVAEALSKVQLWSTHPEMEKRITNLETYIRRHQDQLKKIKKIEFAYPEFVEAVRQEY